MNAVAIFLGAIVVVVLVRIVREISPRHYFEFQELIHGMNNTITWQGIALRFSFPFLVALATGLAIRQSFLFVGVGIGFLASLLLVWPALLDQSLLPYQTLYRKPQIYLVYSMFIASFALLALSGGYVASFLENPVTELLSGSGVRTVIDATTARVDDVLVGLAVLGIGAILAWLWRILFKRVQEDGI